MKPKSRKYLSILKIELEDLADDLEDLLNVYKTDAISKRITEYVSRENASLARHEIGALKLLLREIGAFSTESYENEDEMEEAVTDFFRKNIQERGYPSAIFYLIETKIRKVRRYMKEKDV